MRFRREEIKSFHATDYDFDPRTGTVFLRYAFEDLARERIAFEERIELGGPLRLGEHQERAFERILRLIHAAAGTSYYKAAAPPVVSVDSGPLTASERLFVEDLYDKGLREFAFKNSLPVPLRIEVHAEESAESGESADRREAGDGDPPDGLGIPIGGGKDSIVVVEALRDLKPLLIGVNPAPASRRVADVAGLELVSVSRTLDPLLFELNESGALNGHVPITAVISLIAVAAGYVHGYSTTVLALEGSSDEATRLIGDIEINHQWSKSTECEVEIAGALRAISPGVRYGSVLRGLSELEIGRCFAKLAQYHHIFRSCNRAFSLSGAVDGWCNDCPKCRFVYLTLATSMSRDELVAIFGADLLGSAEQVDGFRDLFDSDRKPFECVGTRSESIAAFEELFSSPVWSGSVVVEQVRSFLPAERQDESSTLRSSSGEDVLRTVRRAADSIIGLDDARSA
jgi:UDP-N-acetyl-alpha-D-muramoyl-L-alanyl-L-glutamate epimerase